jgi:hypothetical protein
VGLKKIQGGESTRRVITINLEIPWIFFFDHTFDYMYNIDRYISGILKSLVYKLFRWKRERYIFGGNLLRPADDNMLLPYAEGGNGGSSKAL